MKTEKGFTLIEVLIALTLVSITLAIAVPQYLQYVARAQAAEGTSLAFGLVDEIQDTYSMSQTVPTALTDLFEAGQPGVLPADHQGRYVESVDIDNGAIVATYGNEAGNEIAGFTLALYAYTNGANDLFYWCSTYTPPVAFTRVDSSVIATTIPDNALPRDCR